mgnify:CR=1 FL=1
MSKVVLPPGKLVESPEDAFRLFFDDSVIKIIVDATNNYAIGKIGAKWKQTTDVEILAYIGLLIEAGRSKNGIADYREFWDPLYGSCLFRACMSKTRFCDISRFLRFDDKSSRTFRRSTDKFAPFRDIWEIVNNNFKKSYLPGENMTIDEQLLPFRGRVSFKQYLPSKPDKYGMKIWWICDSSTSYPLQGIPYLGKEGGNRQTNLAMNVVQKLVQPYENTNRNITFDNYFTSVPLALDLLSKKLTCVGTLRKNKSCIPPNFLPKINGIVNSNTFGFTITMTLVSYVPKKKNWGFR